MKRNFKIAQLIIMKRKIYILLCLTMIIGSADAQKITIDRQKIETGRKKPDSNFVKYLVATATDYSKNITKADSSEALFTEAMMIAEKLNYTAGLIEARENLSQYYFLKGRLSASLDLSIKNQATEIEIGDSTSLFNTLRLVSIIYMRIGDVNMARTTLRRRQLILDNNGIRGLKDTSYQVISQYNSLAHYYSHAKINMLDSAEYFFRKMKNLGKGTRLSNLWDQLGDGGLGRSLSTRASYDSAIYFYRIAMAAALKGKRYDNYYGFMFSMADAYNKNKQFDSAFKYAYSTYQAAIQYSYAGLITSSSGLLAGLYNQQKQYDSVVKYMTVESKYKDSIFGQEALKSIQALTSEEQLKALEKQREIEEAIKEYKATLKNYFFIAGLLLLLIIIGLMYRVNKQRMKSKKQIETAYDNLKSTQSQLIQSEKMASLGELTAGIAHEIQNPLNFVNNFSEVSTELLDEMKDALQKDDKNEAIAIAGDIKENLQKITHHGKRADAIVKGMLQHSQSSSGVKEPTDINKLADEYFWLAYHGLRSKDKSFNATMKTDFDESLGKINIIPQDIGRVILNLITNAFYAVNEKKKAPTLKGENYEPTVTVSTRRISSPPHGGAGGLQLSVIDNGNGIPQKVLDKIFQPFFTTKPTGQGTGLGLSLAYDIVKAHGGELKVETKEGEGSEFIIQLPVV